MDTSTYWSPSVCIYWKLECHTWTYRIQVASHPMGEFRKWTKEEIKRNTQGHSSEGEGLPSIASQRCCAPLQNHKSEKNMRSCGPRLINPSWCRLWQWITNPRLAWTTEPIQGWPVKIIKTLYQNHKEENIQFSKTKIAKFEEDPIWKTPEFRGGRGGERRGRRGGVEERRREERVCVFVRGHANI